MRNTLILLFLALYGVARGEVAITANSPPYNWQVLPGSVRHLNVYITGGTTNLVNYSVSATTHGASAVLGCTSNCLPIVGVTIGSAAGTCSISGSLGNYRVASTATVTITATSVDDPGKSAAFLLNVCANTTTLFVVPFYRTLYANQRADLQSFIVGNTKLDVTWAITHQPAGGDGNLDDTTNRDTVFHATVAGRYTITCKSAADESVTQQVIMYVTGNAMPYPVTTSLTEPIDPTVDPALKGATYDVGPARAHKTIQSVPMNTMHAGSTVRIHNDDTTGSHPTTYHEFFQLGTANNGTSSQPLRVVCVPDSAGNLPIIDGDGATGASWVSTSSAAGLNIASISAGRLYGLYQAGNSQAANLILEGCHFRNANASFKYTPPAGGSPAAWSRAASCIGMRSGFNVVIAGNESENCGNGVFTDANMNNNGWHGNVLGVLWEGNYIHAFGNDGLDRQHGLYIQEWAHVVQFNRIDNPTSGMKGACLKTRSVAEIIRYNYIGDGCSRLVDMVDVEDASRYITFEGYLGPPNATNCALSLWCGGDTMGANVLAGWQEAFNQTFFYGNVELNSKALNTHHFCGDQVPGMQNRQGTLYYYNQTFYMLTTRVGGWGTAQALIDMGCPGNPYQFQSAIIQNNIVWSTSASSPTYQYVSGQGTILATFATNLLAASNPISFDTPLNGGGVTGHTGNGWGNGVSPWAYPQSIPIHTHITGLSSDNFLRTATQPFDSTTWLPINPRNGTSLSGAMSTMPVRFMYRPDLHYALPRNSVVSSSAGGIIGALDVPASVAPSTATITDPVPVPRALLDSDSFLFKKSTVPRGRP